MEMKAKMRIAELRLTRLLSGHNKSAGLYVRVHGDRLIMTRREPPGPDGELENDKRVRLASRSAPTVTGRSGSYRV